MERHSTAHFSMLVRSDQERVTFKAFMYWHINLQALFLDLCQHKDRGKAGEKQFTHSAWTPTEATSLWYSNINFFLKLFHIITLIVISGFIGKHDFIFFFLFYNH